MSRVNRPKRSPGPRRSVPLAKSPDPYRGDAKSADAFVCDGCGVVQHGGRWYHGAAPDGAVHNGWCPACRRARDRRPAGTLHLPPAMAAQREELEPLLRGIEQTERAEHPLERILAIEAGSGGLVITTTGIHLARRLAAWLQRRFHSRPRLHYGDDDLRVDWAE